MSINNISLKKNFIFNTIVTFVNIITPLITFPYLARTIGPLGLGKVGFITSFVQYFIIIASLGIPTYGAIEIAKRRGDRQKISKLFSELLVLNMIATMLIFIIYLPFLFFVRKFQNDAILYLLSSVTILLTVFSFDWLFQGIENFRYLLVRNVISKIVYIVLLFIVIHNQGDYVKYYIITIIINNVIVAYNYFHRKKYTGISFRDLDLKRHIKPLSSFILISFITTACITFDKTFIGFLVGEINVGYYTICEQIIFLTVTISSSLSSVIIPRISYLYNSNNFSEFEKIVEKSISFILLIAFPMAVGIFFVAEDIILLFAGNDFIQSIPTLKILSVNVFLIGIANITGLYFLVSTGNEKKYLFSIFMMMITEIILYLILIPKFKHNGAAIGIVAGYFVQVIIQVLFNKKRFTQFFIRLKYIKFIVATVCMAIYLYFGQFLNFGIIAKILFSCFIYFTLLIIMKEEIIWEELNKIYRILYHEKIK